MVCPAGTTHVVSMCGWVTGGGVIYLTTGGGGEGQRQDRVAGTEVVAVVEDHVPQPHQRHDVGAARRHAHLMTTTTSTHAGRKDRQEGFDDVKACKRKEEECWVRARYAKLLGRCVGGLTLKICETSEVGVSAVNMVYSTISDSRRASSGCTSCSSMPQEQQQRGKEAGGQSLSQPGSHTLNLGPKGWGDLGGGRAGKPAGE